MRKAIIVLIFTVLGIFCLSAGAQNPGKDRKLPSLAVFGDYLKRSFSKDTCIMPQEWEKTNPTFGQCAVSVLIVEYFFGGEILEAEIPREWQGITVFSTHLWNRIDGQNIDFTKEQFPPQFPYNDLINGRLGKIEKRSWEDVFYDENIARNFIIAMERLGEILPQLAL